MALAEKSKTIDKYINYIIVIALKIIALIPAHVHRGGHRKNISRDEFPIRAQTPLCTMPCVVLRLTESLPPQLNGITKTRLRAVANFLE